MMTDEISNDLTALTVDLLSAFVANNNVRADDLPSLIASTHAALAGPRGRDCGCWPCACRHRTQEPRLARAHHLDD
jgi:predicted transcriptional regulator